MKKYKTSASATTVTKRCQFDNPAYSSSENPAEAQKLENCNLSVDDSCRDTIIDRPEKPAAEGVSGVVQAGMHI